MTDTQIAKMTSDVGSFGDDACHRPLIESAMSAFGKVPELGKHSVAGTLDAKTLGDNTTPASSWQGKAQHLPQQSSRYSMPSHGSLASLAALWEGHINVYGMHQPAYRDLNRQMFKSPDAGPYGEQLAIQGRLQDIDRLRAKGEYQSAATELSNELFDMPQPEFFHLYRKLIRDLRASHDVIERAQEALGNAAPPIEAVSADSQPLAAAVDSLLQDVESSVPSQFSGLSEIRLAIQTAAYERNLSGMNTSSYLPMLKDQCCGGSVAARAVLAEIAIGNQQFDLAEELLNDHDARSSPASLVHRRRGELALRRGDGAAAADAFEIAVLVPNAQWSDADLGLGTARQVARLGDYYLVYAFEDKYVLLPQDKPIAGLTRVAGKPVALLKKRQPSWLERNTFEVARKVKHLIERHYSATAAPTETKAPAPQKSQMKWLKNRIHQVLRVMRKTWVHLPRIVNIKAIRSWLEKVRALMLNALMACARIVKRVIGAQNAQNVHALIKRATDLLRRSMKSRLRVVMKFADKVRAVAKGWQHLTFGEAAFHIARATYRLALAPIVMHLIGAKPVRPDTVATNLNELIEQLSDLSTTSDSDRNRVFQTD